MTIIGVKTITTEMDLDLMTREIMKLKDMREIETTSVEMDLDLMVREIKGMTTTIDPTEDTITKVRVADIQEEDMNKKESTEVEVLKAADQTEAEENLAIMKVQEWRVSLKGFSPKKRSQRKFLVSLFGQKK